MPALPILEEDAPRRRVLSGSKGRIHIVIGDTQAKEGVPTQHLTWIGAYIAEQFTGEDVAIIHLGDHWDMPSLSLYDLGKKESEGRRYAIDVDAGNKAFALLNAPIAQAMSLHDWQPERHYIPGNHDWGRIERAANDTAYLNGKVTTDDLDTCGWLRHEYLKPANIDGIRYAHYFYHPKTGKPYGGENLLLRLKTIGHSFTMGHQQGVQYTLREVDGKRQHGLVLGSTYLHDEKYLGPQSIAYWRGIVVCHQVEDGAYDPMFVSLDYLCRRYEGEPLARWIARQG
jgi:hypothetical protein